jgi:hypothetical protein
LRAAAEPKRHAEEEPKAVVKITAVGIEVRNRVLIAGREIEP